MAKKTFYDVLQVSPNADPEIIKAAYRSLCQRHHPDKNPGNPDADKLIKIINRAYEVLSDPVKRAGYDAALADIDEEQPEKSGDTTFTQDAAARKDSSGGANGGSRNAVSEDSQSSSAPRPWIRYWARTIDYVVWGVAIGIVIALLSISGVISNKASEALTNPLLLGMLMVFTWAFVEPIALAVFGTTVGKALLNVKLAHQSDENISKAGLGALYRRSMAVWLKGMGIGFPLVGVITALVSYRNLKSHGETSWDRNGGFIVSHGKVGYVRGGFAITVILVALVGDYLATIYEKQTEAQQQATSIVDDFENFRKREAAQQSQPSSGKSGGYGVNDILVDGTAQQTQQPTTYLSTDPNAGLDGAAPQDQEATNLAALVRAAEQGDANAQFNLGLMYDRRQDVAADYAEAERWVRMAAEQGLPYAQNYLGTMRLSSRGHPQDYVQAYMWFSLAASSGNKASLKNRMAIEARMSPLQIEQGQKLAREWLAKR